MHCCISCHTTSIGCTYAIHNFCCHRKCVPHQPDTCVVRVLTSWEGWGVPNISVLHSSTNVSHLYGEQFKVCIYGALYEQNDESRWLPSQTAVHVKTGLFINVFRGAERSETTSVLNSRCLFILLLCGVEEVSRVGCWAHFLLYVSFRSLWLEVARRRGHKANDWVMRWERRS